MALYERGPDGKVVSQRLDFVTDVPSGYEVTRMPSEADYILSYWQETRPIRILVEHYTLRRRADWRVIATTTRIAYEWTDPNKTLLARTAIGECGSSVTDDDLLLDLVAPRNKSK